MHPTITGLGKAVPRAYDMSAAWEQYFAEHTKWTQFLGKQIWQNSGIRQRHSVVDIAEREVPTWTTAQRMTRFMQEAPPLGERAVGQALAGAGLAADDLGLFAVVSCTGYSTPGLDLILADKMDMSTQVQRLNVGHMGCYAAIPGLRNVADFVAVQNQPAAMLCLELTSLHVQPPKEDDIGQLVAHSLFADAGAAVVIVPGSAEADGWEIIDTVAVADRTNADQMTWTITDHGFLMYLSSKVPESLSKHVRPAMETLLQRNGLDVPDVCGWAIHPGGTRIINVVGEQLDLPTEALDPSFHILSTHGNCSSATVLLVLDEITRRGTVPDGGYAVAAAFGPGLTLYATLLRRRIPA